MNTFFKHSLKAVKGVKKLRHKTNSPFFKGAHGSTTEKAVTPISISLTNIEESAVFTIKQIHVYYYVITLNYTVVLKNRFYFSVIYFNLFKKNACLINIQ